jgi:RecB family exonuclease
VPTAYGRAASATLHEVVRHAKGDEPLAPVTVLVPTNSVGVAARRRLASGELGPLTSAGTGIAGVAFLTVLRLAEQLAAPQLAAAGRRPVSTPVVAAAVRGVLARSPGLFAPVAEHAATEEALVAAHRELANLDEAQLDILAAQHARARDVVRIHRAVGVHLAERWYAEHDLMRVATEIVTQRPERVRDLGTVVCFAPQRWSAPEARLVRALADATDLVVVPALTGVARADAATFGSLGRIGAKVLDDQRVAAQQGTRAFSASDPDDEVRAIVREIVGAMREGVPLERMAVLFAATDPYVRLVHEHLALAAIPHNGSSTHTLADSMLGRTLLRILSLGDNDFRRDDVCALFATAPLLDGHGNRVPGVAWERVARKAGVIGGAHEWPARLAVFIATNPDEHERARVRELDAFVNALLGALERGQLSRTWRDLAQWAHDLVAKFLGGEAWREGWPDFERDAAQRVEATLDRLGSLDAVDRAPTAEVFRRTLEIELRSARVRLAHLGEGVLTGPPSFALGLELERVWVCGLAEGLFPAPARDDPLIGDRERAALGGELPLRAERVDDDQRALLAALASTSGQAVLSWPRGDLRRSTEHVPSRFLEHLLATVRPATIASFADALAHIEFAPSHHELGVRAALAREGWVTTLPEVERNRAVVSARASGAFTRFDGNLGERAQLRLRDADRSVSPTRLEQWVRCPHAYFMRYVLHVDPIERPEDIFQLTPLDRGSMVHDILDEFFRGGDATRVRLFAIAEQACRDAEARGITGRRLLWDRDRRMLFAELDAFFVADLAYRTERGAQTIATERAFTDVAVALSDGSQLKLRGKIDRIDRIARIDGSKLFVVDYKTGRPEYYAGLSADDPVGGGEYLQLPVYAYAAAAAYDEPTQGIEVAYWFIGKGNDRQIGYVVDERVEAEFDAVVRTILDGIERGCFIANPPVPGPRPFVVCEYCDPDGVGTSDRYRETERKWEAPELEAFRSLHEVEVEVEQS